MKKILICGHRSFVAGGLAEKMRQAGFEVDTFSRGKLEKEGPNISGDVFAMDTNPCLAQSYDAVINFIIIKDQGVEENIRYAEALHRFCQKNEIGRLYQISSISTYSNRETYVDEETEIEKDYTLKGGYASVKVAVDHFLMEQERSYELSFIRPGFIVSDEKQMSLAGIVKQFGPIGLLLGNKRTALPLIEKDVLHEAVIRIVQSEKQLPIYLLLENMRGTKQDFAQRYYGKHTVSLPKSLTLFAAKLLKAAGVFKARHMEQIVGLFKETFFDSAETEYALQMSFSKNSVAVIGSGAYGSYTINRLLEMKEKQSVTLFDPWHEGVKDEDEAGYGTNLTGASYTGLKKGRFFGFGGATVKWGGQLLMFTENDFKNPSEFMKGIIRMDQKWKDKVFERFGFQNKFEENQKGFGLFTKTGIWLGYFSRNLFKHFGILKKKVMMRTDSRVARFMYDKENNIIYGLEYVTKDGRIKHAYFDQYFLCAGAFESNRIVLSSGMVDGDMIHFSDHLSQKIFKINGKPIISGEDYQFGIQGTSLVTKRLIGEVNDVSFFANPIYNADFPFFQNLKKIMFKDEISLAVIGAILKDIPSVFGFVWSMAVKHKIYVYKNTWNMFIDIENETEKSCIRLSEEKDQWGLPKLDVFFEVGDVSKYVYDTAKKQVADYLDANGVNYESEGEEIHVEKSEDTYHPYAMFMSDSKSIEDYFTRYSNLLIVNTGILPRAGGINTTASCMPLIEEYIGEYYGKR